MCECVSNVCDMVEMIWNRMGFSSSPPNYSSESKKWNEHTLFSVTLQKRNEQNDESRFDVCINAFKIVHTIHGCKCRSFFCPGFSKMWKYFRYFSNNGKATSRWVFWYCPFVGVLYETNDGRLFFTGFLMCVCECVRVCVYACVCAWLLLLMFFFAFSLVLSI